MIFVDNKDQPRQVSRVAVSGEATFFAVSGGRCNALMEASGSVTTRLHLQSYNLIRHQ